jgi:hypothetical protein
MGGFGFNMYILYHQGYIMANERDGTSSTHGGDCKYLNIYQAESLDRRIYLKYKTPT